jgi:hypothetical protein
VGHTLLCTLVFPVWVLGAHLHASVNKQARWYAYIPWLASLFGLVFGGMTAALGQSFVGALVFLFWSAVLALAARKVMWRAATSTAPGSGQPVAAGSNATPGVSGQGGAP